ncbi:amidohydrolase family protein [candidate division KSB1 bacterium]|nr:amidohydrolase family protein [candidate division KSB1 bacterium]
MGQEIIDMHIHFGAPENESNGCYWSAKFTETPAYYAMLALTKSLCKKVDFNRVQKQLLGVINGSRLTNKAVLLAMDQVYDEKGAVHREWTHLHTPNRFLIELAQSNPKVLVGASIHPYRRDWQEELDYCLENRAVLCKWIPSSQLIKPDSKLCVPLYKKLAQHHLPLLCHAGPEYAIPTSDDSYNKYNNPVYLRQALDLGVTVILAHCALPYFWLLDEEYKDDFEEFRRLFQEAEQHQWQLYADVSALATPTRIPYVDIILNEIPSDRLLYGSDYPIPISEFSYNKSKNLIFWLRFITRMIRIKNPLDKNYHLINEMGFADTVFENPQKLFARIQY